MATTLSELLRFTDQLLEVASIKDYCPNGLQVEGKATVKKIVTGVTANLDLIDAAIAENADAILVHHGYFWKGEDPCIKGMKKRRLAQLLKHDISLIGYHLPLDIHAVLGNNVQLAERLGLIVESGLEPDNPRSVGLYGALESPLSSQEFAQRITTALNRTPLHIDAGPSEIRTVGWCTGAAQGYIQQAIDLGLDAYITGEVSEPTVHAARENGIHFFAAGHHATERYGIEALGLYLADQLDLEHRFIDIDNPV